MKLTTFSYRFLIFFFNFLFNLIELTIYRKFLLFLAGAKIGKNLIILGRCKFDYPWRLIIGNNCYITTTYFDCRGGSIILGNNIDISEGTKIFTLSHDINSKNFATVSKKVIIKDRVWIASSCIVLPGSVLNTGCVLSANSVGNGQLKSYFLYVGNYAVKIKKLSFSRSTRVRCTI